MNRVVSTLKSLRSRSLLEFKKQFGEAERIAKLLHGDQFELTRPRLSGRQSHRSNPPSSDPEEYYRITLYNEFFSHVVYELEERFVNNPSHSVTIGLFHLLPSECLKVSDDTMVPDELAEAVELFKGDLPHAVMFRTEYDSWVRQWQESSSTTVPDTLVTALTECNVLTYPNLNALLTLALTLPVTLCESERSFSQLKIIKTARRTTMSESRLSSLALMKINRNRCNQLLTVENMGKLIKTFIQLHPRRIKLPFMLPDD